MDGNRRWAKEQWLPWYRWHKAWAENITRVIEAANDKGIQYITLWWLSTENLKKRSAKEVTELLKLIVWSKKYLKAIQEKNWKIELVWDIERIPKIGRMALNYLVENTKNNTGITIVLALAYGWKNEIIRGIKKFVSEGWSIDKLDEESFLEYMDTGKYPAPDVIVRTGWDIRHSGFLLYQSDYSEYYFTETRWPDFNGEELEKVYQDFAKSKRNFWK